MVSVSRYIVLNFFQKMKILIVISDISKTKKHINPKMKYFYVKNIYVLYKNVNFSQVPIQNIALISIFLSFILFIFHKCYQLQIHSYNTRSMFYFSNAFCKMQNQDNLLKTPTNNFHLTQTKWKFIPDMFFGPWQGSPLPNFGKSFIIDIWQNPHYTSVF